MYMTVRICLMVYMVLLGADFFNHFIFIAGLNDLLLDFVKGLHLPNTVLIFAILVMMTVMGCVLDIIALLMLSVPIFAPLMDGLGFDLVWFGVIMIVAIELALITPPVGVNIYIIKDMAPPGTRMSDVIWGVLPYIVVVWILFILLVLFPELVSWLPSTMRT